MKKAVSIVLGLVLIAGISANAQDLTTMYSTVKVTGSGLEMEQVYSLANLLELAEIASQQSELKELCTAQEYEGKEISGLDMKKFLSLCGEKGTDESVRILTEEDTVLAGEDAVIVLSIDGAIPEDGIDILSDGTRVSDIKEILVGENLHYEMHNRAPHDESADITFSFNLYKDGQLDITKTLTTTELETLTLEHPEAVYGSWYGIIGNEEDIESMGTGGYLDYYEGLRVDFLLKEVLGLENFDGRAELFGRDGEVFSTIEDISYFEKDAGAYYMCTSDGDVIFGKAIPILAYAKNGSPLLPDHEHESEGYVRSTPIRDYLKDLGMEEIKLGVVKNHSGPFVAALGDCDGYYGGYQMETSGDCVQMDIYLN